MSASSIVCVDWLQKHIDDQNLRVIDASWHLPPTGRSGRDEFLIEHIRGAVFFDIDECSTQGPLPHTLPTSEYFAKYVGGLGISETDHVVIYDANGWFSAARVWWMLRHFGSRSVSVLDGGLAAWKAKGFTLEAGKSDISECRYRVTDNNNKAFGVALAEQVLLAANTKSAQIVDARSSARFQGVEKEFRPGLRSGHIPSSLNVPFAQLIDDGKMKNDAQLLAVFESAGLDSSKPVIASCGSGVTAAIVILALHKTGFSDVSLYDGSWTDWGSDSTLPIESGKS